MEEIVSRISAFNGLLPRWKSNSGTELIGLVLFFSGEITVFSAFFVSLVTYEKLRQNRIAGCLRQEPITYTFHLQEF